MLSPEVIDQVIEATRGGGAEVIALLKSGSAYIAPSSAAARMVRAVAKDEGVVLPVCAWLDGEFGLSDVYLGVPAKLDRGGVAEVVELDLEDQERSELEQAAEAVRGKQADVDSLV
jgi:malate dehydrogenase